MSDLDLPRYWDGAAPQPITVESEDCLPIVRKFGPDMSMFSDEDILVALTQPAHDVSVTVRRAWAANSQFPFTSTVCLQGDYRVRLTDDWDWSRGTYGDSRSCLFNDAKDSRHGLIKAGAGVLQFFNVQQRNRGTGRVFTYQAGNKHLAVFGAYGQCGSSKGQHHMGLAMLGGVIAASLLKLEVVAINQETVHLEGMPKDDSHQWYNYQSFSGTGECSHIICQECGRDLSSLTSRRDLLCLSCAWQNGVNS